MPQKKLLSTTSKRTAIAAGALIAIGTVFAAGARIHQVKGERSYVNLTYKNEVKIEVKDGYRVITSNGIPDHTVGKFPGYGNPNTISPQKYSFNVPLSPKPAAGQSRVQIFGIAVNGVVFDPGTAELWNNNFQYHYEALSGVLSSRNSLGVDENLAHVQPNGAYHYHGIPRGLLTKLDYTHKMALVGWAADGYPIYGPYIYSKANDASSSLVKVSSSYKLKDGNRPGGDGPGGAYDGSFASDFVYAKTGELDQYNGRTGVTPEFPKGTYYYVLTENFPFIPRQFKGQPDSSFSKGGPGGPGGGPGGPGGRQGGRQGGAGGVGRAQGNYGLGGPGQGQGGPPDQGGFGGPGGPGGPGQGGPGGQRGGPPRNMVPGDALVAYLELTPAQKAKYADFKKLIDALNEENFAMGSIGALKVTPDQIKRVGAGEKLRKVLSAKQIETMEANLRPAGGFGGPPGGGQGGPGGPGGPGGGGPGGGL